MTARTNTVANLSSKRKTRVIRSKAQWQALVTEYEASELTQQAFCKQHGIATSGLNKWRKRFSRSTESEFVNITGQLCEAGSHKNHHPDNRWQVELQLGQGVVLRIGLI